MNSASPSIPGLKSLYYVDPIIGRAAFIVGFSLIAAAGIYWIAQPVPSAVKVENSPIELWVMHWGPVAALVVAALAMFVLLRRHAWLKNILTHGSVIQGIVEDVTVYEREAPRSDNAPAFKRAKTRSYYTVIRYAFRGVENKVRFKLPFSPSTYQITKGGEVDLILLDSAPKKPVIRKVYLGGIFPGNRPGMR